MFNMGFTEMIFLGVIALIVIGPKQLPEVARVVARTLNEFKRATSEITKPFKDLKKDAQNMADKARSTMLDTENMIGSTTEVDPFKGHSEPESLEKHLAGSDHLSVGLESAEEDLTFGHNEEPHSEEKSSSSQAAVDENSDQESKKS